MFCDGSIYTELAMGASRHIDGPLRVKMTVEHGKNLPD